MQFFPLAEVFSLPTQQASTGSKHGETYNYAPLHKGSVFKDIFAKLSPYNSANTPGVPVTMRSSKDDNSYLKSDDFKFLKQKLNELGVSPQAIDNFFRQISAQANYPAPGALASSPFALGKNERSTEALTEQEMIAWRALTEKLGFTKEELDDLEEKLSSGNSLEVLRAFQSTLDEQEITLSQDELLLICRAADLDEEQIAPVLLLWNELAPEGTLAFSAETFDKLFGTTLAELEQSALQMQELAAKLGQAVQAMLENKQLSKNDEPVSDKRGSAFTERAEIMARIIATLINEEESKDKSSTSHLIDDSKSDRITGRQSTMAALLDKAAEEVAREPLEERLNGRERQEMPANKSGAAHFGAAANNGKNSQVQSTTAQRAVQENTPHGPAESVISAASGSQENASGDKSRQDFAGSAKQNATAELSADKAALNAKVQEASGLVFGMFGNEPSALPEPSAMSTKNTIYQERVFEQIERGLIRNATDGSKQITLRLDPPELGKLTLSLTVAQGEVKAMIRTESSATTQVVSEQLAQLKQSLEEQGFKVSSLEVETRPQSHAGTDGWNGMDQHNQEHELQEQQRFIRLSQIRAKEGETLAQSVQYIEQPASISASGLHLIA